MTVVTRTFVILLATAALALATGCGGPPAPAGGPAAGAPPAAQPSPVGRTAPDPATQPVGYLQLAHFAPRAQTFDGFFGAFGQQGKLLGSGGYGYFAQYTPLPPGRYVWSMRPVQSPPQTPMTLTKLIDVTPGRSSTVVLFNNGPGGALQGVVAPSDTGPSPAGTGKLRILQGADGPALSISLGQRPAENLPYGTVTPYQVVPAGRTTVAAGGAATPLPVDVTPGSLTTVLVTSGPRGVVLSPASDGVAGPGSPARVELPTGVNSGDGGHALDTTVASGAVAPASR